MGIFNIGYHARRDREREMVRGYTVVAGLIEIGGGQAASVDGDFTKGLGQGLGITAGIVGAAWLAGKIMRE